MDAMITLVGTVVLKVESELQCFIYNGMLLMLIYCLEMMCFLLIDSVGKLGCNALFTMGCYQCLFIV